MHGGGLTPVAPDVPAQAVAIAAVGSHSGLALGVSDALSAALGDVRLSYFGHWAWCQNVDNCQARSWELFNLAEQPNSMKKLVVRADSARKTSPKQLLRWLSRLCAWDMSGANGSHLPAISTRLGGV